MPPKRQEESDEESTTEATSTDEETSTTTEESDDDETVPSKAAPGSKPGAGATGGAGGGAVGTTVLNRHHDEEFSADDGPVAGGARPSGAAAGGAGRGGPTAAGGPAASGARGGAAVGSSVANRHHDEEFSVDDKPTGAAAGSSSGAGGRGGAKASGTMIVNDQHDEFQDVEDDMPSDEDVPTPVKKPTQGAASGGAQQGRGGAGGGRDIRDQGHDYEMDAGGSSTGGSPATSPPKSGPGAAAGGSKPGAKASGIMRPPTPDSPSEASSEDDDHHDGKLAMAAPTTGAPMALGTKPTSSAPLPSLDYDPSEYAAITKKAPPEIRDLFAHITAFQPTTAELPAKLRPFIPDLVPCVGDIDTFCKVPRPDGKPDQLGLMVVDEPCSKQTNPAVVKIALLHFSKVSGHQVAFVDSVEDAHNRPQVIDRWIADIKELQHKKPLPTVTYSKPMPDIERLMQAWPPEFEELLNSDVMLPPPHIDLDINQYVKLLCTILDIPVYGSLIESLHVMFTLYLEFRSNQHFQHA